MAAGILAPAPRALGLTSPTTMSVDAPTVSPDIARLTRQMKQGTEQAYREFYGLYFDRLLRYLLVITRGQEEPAREALQLTLMRVVRHIKVFTSEEILWSWLTVLARSSVVDEHRRQKRYTSFLERWFSRTQVQTEHGNPDVDTRFREILESELAGLTAEERALVERKYFSAESIREIARSSDLTEKALESRLVRIRRKLKDAVLKQLHDENTP